MSNEKVKVEYYGDDISSIPKEDIIICEENKYGHTSRALKSRHVQFIALGGCIGTGLFVGSGAILSNAGPGSLLCAYIIMSFVIWAVMNALGEMTTYLPVQGVSPPGMVGRYACPDLSFATSYIYIYSFALLVPSECVAGAIVAEYCKYCGL